MAVFARRFGYLIHLGGGNVLLENATNPFAVKVNFQHDLRGGLAVLVEKFLDNDHDKLHRRVVIVEQNDLEHLRRLGFLRTTLQNDRISAPAIVGPDSRHRRAGG